MQMHSSDHFHMRLYVGYAETGRRFKHTPLWRSPDEPGPRHAVLTTRNKTHPLLLPPGNRDRLLG